MQTKLNQYIVTELFKNKEWEKGFEICASDTTLHELYKKTLLNCCKELMTDNKYIEALCHLRKAYLLFQSPLLCKYIGYCLYALNNLELSLEFFKLYEHAYPRQACVLPCANICDSLNLSEEAIHYYELSLEQFPDNYRIYGNLGRLYSDLYGFKECDKQLNYVKKAYELNPNDSINLINLFLVYAKLDRLTEAEECFRLLEQRFVENIPYFEFGQLLIRHRRFQEGYLYCRERFKRDSNIFPKMLKNQWQPFEDIKNKTVLVTYEQGYGDTFMYIRFIKQVKCKKLKVLVQDDIYDLIKDSFDFEIYKESELEQIKYDCFIPVMDLMLLLNITPETILDKEGYLTVKDSKYANIPINNKFKIGISYEGIKSAKHCQRDIPLKFLYPIMELPNVEIYNFQKEDSLNQKADIPNEYNVIDLGQTFNNWYDTAKALKNMDLMITTDNGILNLAGALGVKTFGLFNWHTDGRWFNLVEDVGWYNIKPFQCKEFNNWQETITRVIEETKRLIKEKEVNVWEELL